MHEKIIIDVSDCKKKGFEFFFLKVGRLKSVRRMSDGSVHADGHEIANDRDPKTVFEVGTQSSPDDADLRWDGAATDETGTMYLDRYTGAVPCKQW